MADNIVYKILRSHLLEGELKEGEQIKISVDQTLGHDLTAIMAGQVLAAVDADKVATEASVFYCDHNVLATTSENTDDHVFLKTSAARFGAYFSKPGNGICHFLHCQRFAKPGKVMLGADSHTPTSGALGMLAIGNGGLTVAKAALGEGFKFTAPKVLEVRLEGKLKPGVAAKDVALELLRILSVKGCIGYVVEYTGSGIATLSIPERQTIANMSIEMGATTGIFPADEVTKAILEAQDRGADYVPLMPDADAQYDRSVCVNMSELQPLVALPSMPDNVFPVSEAGEVKPQSVFIGSCTNASYSDIRKAAVVLRGRKVHPDIDCTIAAGSRQVLQQLIDDGVIGDLVAAGCRILESACGPCIGVGQVPCHNGLAVRTSNRNFPGRCGNNDAGVCIVSPETAAATAIRGVLCAASDIMDPAELAAVHEPAHYRIDDSMIIRPEDIADNTAVQVIKGPNISDLPMRGPVLEQIEAGVVIKLGDNVTTDDIIPAGASILKYIANIPKFAEYTFCYTDPKFVQRAKDMGTSIIVGGENYGQGSSREHAAMLPMFLGVQAVIAKTYARIHKENLFNYGILPLQFKNNADYELITQEDNLEIRDVLAGIDCGEFTVRCAEKGYEFQAILIASESDKEMLRLGGALNVLAAKLKQ